VEKMLFTPAEVAELLGLGRTRIYELIGRRAIPSIRIGGSVRVPAESLREWVRKQTQESEAAAS